LVLIPPNKRTAKNFVEIVYELALEHYYYHENYEHLILMEDGILVHHSNVPKFWKEKLGLMKLNWPANPPDLNLIENL
jgi:hypothetical protein